MVNWISSLPNMSAYGTPTYFIYLLIAILPLGIGLYFGKRFSADQPGLPVSHV